MPKGCVMQSRDAFTLYYSRRRGGESQQKKVWGGRGNRVETTLFEKVLSRRRTKEDRANKEKKADFANKKVSSFLEGRAS